jgi:hypothetical protein
LLGLVPDKEKAAPFAPFAPKKARIVFERSGVLYDVRQKRHLGSGSVFEIEIEPGVPRLFALVENRIGELELQANTNARLGEAVTLQFRIASSPQLRSVAKVRVTDPAGREIRHYGGNREISGGMGSISFRTALNDSPGVWRVAVTEAISGETATVALTVK